MKKKATESTCGLELLAADERWHDLSAGFADELRDGNDGVAACAEGFDEFGQSIDGGLTVAAAIVHEDDRALHPRLGLRELDLAEDAVDDLLWRLARRFAPVVGVDLVADDGVAELLDVLDGSGLVVGVGLLIDGVGRTEVDGLYAELGGEEALGEVELKVDGALGDFADVGVREGVIADLVAFTVDPLHGGDVVLCLLADHEEGSDDVLLLEDVEDLRRPDWVGTVVKGDRDLFGVVAVLRDGVGQGVLVHRLGDDGEVLRRDGGVVVHGDGAAAVLRWAGDAEDVAVAFGIDVPSGRDVGEGLGGIDLEGIVPDVPDGRVFRAEAPEGEGLKAEGAGDAHLVKRADGVEKPDLMADVRVFVDVGEVRVE